MNETHQSPLAELLNPLIRFVLAWWATQLGLHPRRELSGDRLALL
jgi:hypothetical protein